MPRTSIAPIGLSEQQLKYVKHRSRGLSATQAARNAGYAHAKQAANIVERQERVQAALKHEIEQYRIAAQITREEVIEGMKEAINQAKLIADPTAQIRGWSELAKMLGYYAPEVKKLELSVKAAGKRQQLELLSDDELLELAAGTAKVIEGEVLGGATAKTEAGAEAPAAGGENPAPEAEAQALRADEAQEGRPPLGGGDPEPGPG